MRTRALIGALIVALTFSAWAQNSEEADLIARLSSDAPVAEKDAACHRLKEIGTTAAIPALAACLLDDALSHPARQALESMRSPEAGEALIAALDKTDGLNRVGIIDSLGLRREKSAVPELIPLLSDPDATTAGAAARALGRIGTEDVVEPLKGALNTGNPAAVEALLRCAQQLRKDGRDEDAFQLAAELCSMDLPGRARVAAHRARMLAAGNRMTDLAIEAITGADDAARTAALGLAAHLPGAAATRALAAALEKVKPPIQVALLKALAARADTTAQEAVAGAAESPDPSVRLAALNALGDLGDSESVDLLAYTAANAPDPEGDAAREALTLLRGGDVCKTMTRMLRDAPAAEQVELAKALAARRETQSVPALIELARRSPEPVEVAALKALGVLAGESEAGGLIELMVAAPSDAVRDAAEDAVVRVAGRCPEPGKVVDALLTSEPRQPAQVISVLTAAARIDFARALPRLHAGTDDADPAVRGGAVRVLAQYCGLESKDRLLDLAAKAAGEDERTLILRGYWRVVDLAKDESPEARFEMVRAGLAAAKSVESRKSGVAALAGIPLKAALDCAEQARADEAVKPEAELAMYALAASLFFAERDAATAALESLADSATDQALRTKASALTSSLSEHADYVVPWLVSNAFRQEDKEAQALFNIPFAPELGGGDVEWKLQPGPADLSNFWQVDLSSVVGGNHCVVYLKTQVFSEKGGAAALEIGSDDGIKLWVNGALVHANNAVRGFTPGQDKAAVNLDPGWNTFLAKVTQHTAGCAMAIRLPEHPFRVEPE
ncbi:MAG TPA: HEAT repeat domain-containing protein [Candidatus Bathyarchaeia archaeon]|nr:HEAT repeat domain-containing protein [Candidatus Bathyarchaeia archaeon]